MNSKKKIKKTIAAKRANKKSYIIIAAVFIFVTAIFAFKAVNYFSGVKHENVKAEYVAGEIPYDMVCMVNNNYMGVAQIPVEADGKIYYGCCEMCVSKLTSNSNNVRYAVDPLSKESVDKAQAYIMMDPVGNGKVLYFISKNNADKYVSQ